MWQDDLTCKSSGWWLGCLSTTSLMALSPSVTALSTTPSDTRPTSWSPWQRLTWRFSLATDQPKTSPSTPPLVSLPPKYTSLVDPPRRCSTSASSSQRDMRLICPSWSTTTVLDQLSPAARAWCSVKAASAWAQTATSWGRGTTCCAPSPPNQLPAPQQAASTTDQNAHRANQTASGWSALTATSREQHSAAWASQPAAGVAAAAPSWNQAFSVPSEINKTMWEDLRESDWKIQFRGRNSWQRLMQSVKNSWLAPDG